MTLSLAPSQSSVQATLRAFMLTVLPPGVEVVKGQVNRVPPPAGADYVVVTATQRVRLATNVDTYADAAFTASCSGTTMTVSATLLGSILPGSTLSGVGIPDNAVVVLSQTSGAPGGAGAYLLSQPLSLGSQAVSAGNELLEQDVQLTFQIDVYGPSSAENAQIISTMLRDDYSQMWWTRNGYFSSAPLHADDPRQIPFLDEEQQVETRWSVDCLIQVNQTVTAPMQFAGVVTVGLVNVDEAFPA